MKVLIVEDSNRLRKSLTAGLQNSGFSVDAVEDGELALQYAEAFDYSVIILDLMLPKMDGLTVLSQLRFKGCSANVLILSAKDQVKDRIDGLQQGADDYLIKPFDFDELVARVNALVRRKNDAKNPVIQVGEISINTALHTVSHANAQISLTPTELKILEYLALRRGRTITAANLEIQVYDSGTHVSKNAMEVHVSALRKKLAAHTNESIIQTRRGFGYFIEV